MTVPLLGCAAQPRSTPQEAHAGQAQPTASLVNTYWKLLALGQQAVLPAWDNQPQAHLVLESLGNTPVPRMHGAGGCNRLMASYRLQGQQLSFGPVGLTRQACPHGMAQEAAFVAALGQVQQYRLEQEQLLLLDAQGQVLLRLAAEYLR